jgi:hypothetical protein
MSNNSMDVRAKQPARKVDCAGKKTKYKIEHQLSPFD